MSERAELRLAGFDSEDTHYHHPTIAEDEDEDDNDRRYCKITFQPIELWLAHYRHSFFGYSFLFSSLFFFFSTSLITTRYMPHISH